MKRSVSLLLAHALVASSVMLGMSFILALVRLMRGPSSADRVVALDLMSSLAIGSIATYVIAAEQPVYLDVAIALALLAFLGTVAFARYLERHQSDA